MIIEDPDSFKAWLTAKLGPLCDADPEALAKYVYALVKKDKPLDELRASMVGQLEVFLQRETQNFVNLLFRTLETQVFDLTTENAALPAPPSPTAPKVGDLDVDLREPPPPASGSQEDSDKKSLKETDSGGILATIASSAQNSNSLGCVLLAASNRRDSDKHIRKIDSDKDERPLRRGVRRRGSSPSPDRRRSRSRSFDRRRSRSRERERGRAWRNKSPPLRRYERSRRSFSKSPQPRRLKSGSPQSKRISRRSYSKSPHRRYSSRSPQGKRIRYRNRSPPHSRSRTRSRSRSPIIGRDRKDVTIGLTSRENSHGDADPRGLQSVVNMPDLQSYARRCRDFDEQGFCIRGDLCPYDHGADPVVLEDVQMYNGGGGPPPAPPVIPPPGGPPPPLMRHPVHPGMRPPPPSINLTTEYNPDAPSMDARMWARPSLFRGPMMRGMMRGVGGRGGFPPQRDLINCVSAIPPFRHQRPLMNSMNDYGNGRIPNADGKPFDFNRLGGGPRQPFSGKSGNASLQLKKVPPGVNNITHLNSHFSKFGKIVNIQVGFEGDPESALITFSSPTEANIAYKSTEAVLNNRFIRVFWYNPDYASNANNENKQENAPPTTRPSVMERLGDHPAKVPLNNIQPSAVQPEEKTQVTLGVNNSLSKTLYIPSAMKKELPKEKKVEKEPVAQENKTKEVNELLMKKIEQVAVAKKKQQESIKAGMKLNADLRKRKTELLEKQINQQKLLIQRLEAPNVTPQQKATLMDTIKTLQDSIENIRKDLETSVKAIAPKVPEPVVAAPVVVPNPNATLVKKTREETQRELLDAELDLINSQNEGKEAEALRKKVADLKMRAYSLGLTSTRGTAFRGRGTAVRIRGRGRGAKFVNKVSYEHNVVDHRPTKVLVSGYEQDDKADVITHFEKYGQIVDYISDDATPSLVLNFKSRKEAENAINKGRNFSERLLSVTWATSNMNIRKGVVTKPPTPVQRSVMVMEDDELGEEMLEEGDEDDSYLALSPVYFPNEGEMEEGEDEEEDERSWKR